MFKSPENFVYFKKIFKSNSNFRPTKNFLLHRIATLCRPYFPPQLLKNKFINRCSFRQNIGAIPFLIIDVFCVFLPLSRLLAISVINYALICVLAHCTSD